MRFERPPQRLRGDHLEDLVFGPSQEVRLIHLPQLVREVLRAPLVLSRSVLEQPSLDHLRVVATELVEAPEYLRLYKVEDRPQLAEVVLQRRACKYQSVAFDAKRDQVLPEFGVDVLGLVALVDDEHVVAHLAQVDLLARDHTEARDEDAALSFKSLDLLLSVGALLVLEGDDVRRVVTPLAQLALPVALHCGGNNDYSLLDLIRIKEPLQVRAYLHSLSEAHVVAEDAALSLPEQRVQPLNPPFLMFEQVLVHLRREVKSLRQIVQLLLRVDPEPALLLPIGHGQALVGVGFTLLLAALLRQVRLGEVLLLSRGFDLLLSGRLLVRVVNKVGLVLVLGAPALVLIIIVNLNVSVIVRVSVPL